MTTPKMKTVAPRVIRLGRFWVESLSQGPHFVLTGCQQVEQGDHRTLELSAAACVHRGRGERLPHDRLADVGRDKEGNSGAKTVAFLEQFVKQEDNETSHEKLDDDE